jgi:uncharacterized membrane protein YkgB
MSIHEKLLNCDDSMIGICRKWALPFSKFSIFAVYFWFGLLKIFELSPASPLVSALLAQTMPWIAPETFLIAFGLLEVIIGIIFLIPHLERLAIFALVLHLITTIMPLFLLPEIAWSGFLVPTLEGQYILKNILLLALGIVILARLHSDREQILN